MTITQLEDSKVSKFLKRKSATSRKVRASLKTNEKNLIFDYYLYDLTLL